MSKVSELTAKKNAKVEVRVPVHMQKEHKLAETVTGKVGDIRTEGRLARVTVLVRGKPFEFRPQDISLVS